MLVEFFMAPGNLALLAGTQGDGAPQADATKSGKPQGKPRT